MNIIEYRLNKLYKNWLCHFFLHVTSIFLLFIYIKWSLICNHCRKWISYLFFNDIIYKLYIYSLWKFLDYYRYRELLECSWYFYYHFFCFISSFCFSEYENYANSKRVESLISKRPRSRVQADIFKRFELKLRSSCFRWFSLSLAVEIIEL